MENFVPTTAPAQSLIPAAAVPMETRTVEPIPAATSEKDELNPEPVVEPTVEPVAEPLRPLFDPPVQNSRDRARVWRFAIAHFNAWSDDQADCAPFFVSAITSCACLSLLAVCAGDRACHMARLDFGPAEAVRAAGAPCGA